MVGLAIHTSSPDLGLALIDDRGAIRAQTWPLGRDLSSHFHNHLQTFLAPCSLGEMSFIAVAKGPGGFTGTRIGVVAARTLAQQLDVPLFGISSLAAIAQNHYRQTAQATAAFAAVELRAQRGEVFGAIYTCTGQGVKAAYPETVQPQADWETVLDQWPAPCDRLVVEGGCGAAVTGVLTLAVEPWQRGDRPHWSTVLPFYGQHPVPGC
jgi:tRNA threonylcarbamoyl adenosine modification protein YeaZ